MHDRTWQPLEKAWPHETANVYMRLSERQRVREGDTFERGNERGRTSRVLGEATRERGGGNQRERGGGREAMRNKAISVCVRRERERERERERQTDRQTERERERESFGC